MGKLAERLADKSRAGVYRVEVTEALEEAAGIVGLPIVRLSLRGTTADRLPGECGQAADAPGQILLIDDFDDLARRDADALRPLIAALASAADRHRSRGDNFFAVFLDPGRLLAIGPLYDRRRHSSRSMPIEAILEKGEES
ncbi:hypothetical protein [Zeimonas arvi]|uniref:ATP-binding protein n=1 Tax=Zeimonas arvi TaxID=2498847 RepID=A0A5C8NVN5_9BURK|nr:hypothetical protein [Zeimonas arvi]TXL65287.1 hypothetical protein FHP08_10840 [Zeimonas arvi]